MSHTCVECGADLAGSHPARKYCSSRCKNRNWQAKPKGSRVHKCRICKVSIPLGEGQGNKWLCSVECKKAMKRPPKAEVRPNRKPSPLLLCRHCGRKLIRKEVNGRLREEHAAFCRRKYCNRACMAADMEGKVKVPSEAAGHRQSRKANRGICNRCGATRDAAKLHVHHKDRNPQNNAWDNLETLCALCHRREHSKDFFRECKCCEKRARHYGLCPTHATRFKRNGDPLIRRVYKKGVWVPIRDPEKVCKTE